jgi:carbamoyl-phosphate synthase large subunit
MIGATKEAIDKAEDRDLFRQAMRASASRCRARRSRTAWKRRIQVQAQIGFPCIIRPSFTMGGSGGGIAYNREEFEEICRAASTCRRPPSC